MRSHPEAFAFAVGRRGGQLQRTHPYRGVTAIGPVRSGKTTGLVVPTIARQRVRTITISVRADVINATLPARYGKDPVWVVDPMGMLPGHRTVGWNPLRLCRDWDSSVDFAYSFVMSAAMTGILDGGFWYAKAAQLLAPLLLAASANGYTVADVTRWVRDQDDFEVRALLQAVGDPVAISSFEAVIGLEDRTRGSIYATLHACLRVFDSSKVIESTTGRGFELDDFFASDAGVLYLAAPPHRQRQLAPLYSALINHVIYRAVEENLRTSEPADLLVLLDEAGNFPIPNLDTLATTCAGSGIQLVTVFHDVSQIVSLYGEDRTQTILSNQSALLILPGARDSRT
ncbi:MAG: type IV secretory system conjugative DNA transfer family protein, partial [Acidimicrobiales bacterium]